jgi:hypothetical protein
MGNIEGDILRCQDYSSAWNSSAVALETAIAKIEDLLVVQKNRIKVKLLKSIRKITSFFWGFPANQGPTSVGNAISRVREGRLRINTLREMLRLTKTCFTKEVNQVLKSWAVGRRSGKSKAERLSTLKGASKSWIELVDSSYSRYHLFVPIMIC